MFIWEMIKCGRKHKVGAIWHENHSVPTTLADTQKTRALSEVASDTLNFISYLVSITLRDGLYMLSLQQTTSLSPILTTVA